MTYKERIIKELNGEDVLVTLVRQSELDADKTVFVDEEFQIFDTDEYHLVELLGLEGKLVLRLTLETIKRITVEDNEISLYITI